MRKEKIALDCWLEIIHKDRHGKIKGVDGFPLDTITNTGLACAAGQLNNVVTTHFTYLAVGTGTTAPSITDTALQAEITDSGLARASATASRVTTTITNDTMQLTYTWTASGTKAVTEAGAFDAASSGNMLCRQVFSAKNMESGDTLTLTYKVQCSRAA